MSTADVWRKMYGVEYEEKTRLYSYPNGHLFRENDICQITSKNEHGQPHEFAGALVVIRQQPHARKMTYSVTVHEESSVWPKGILTTGMRFNEHEVNLTLVKRGEPTPPKPEYEKAWMILEEGAPEYGLYVLNDVDDFVERLTSYDLDHTPEGDERRKEIKQTLMKMSYGLETIIEGKRVLRFERIK